VDLSRLRRHVPPDIAEAVARLAELVGSVWTLGGDSMSEINIGDAMQQVVNAADPPTSQLDIIERMAALSEVTTTLSGTYDRCDCSCHRCCVPLGAWGEDCEEDHAHE
jgi:hypothetical protein